MPMTKEGKKVMNAMMKEYGPEKGKSVFYASVNAKKAGSSKWHRKTKGNYGSKAVTMARAMKK